MTDKNPRKRKAPEKRKNHRLRAVLASSGEGFVVVDLSGTVRLMNEAAETILGRQRGDVVGRPVAALSNTELMAQIEQAIAAGGKAAERTVSLAVDGRSLTCKVTPFSSATEKGVTLTIRDDTELVRQQERAEAILSSTGDGLMVFSPDNRVTYINQAACDMLGTRPARVMGKRRTMSVLLGLEPPPSKEALACWDMLSCRRVECPAHEAEDLRCWLVAGTLCDEGRPETFREKMSSCYACDVYLRNSRLLEECGMSFTRELTLSEPAYRILQIRTNPVIDTQGNYIGCVKNLHDITAEREISQMKNEFVSTVSHELRTPLTSIKGYVDLILDGEAGDINEIQREFLQIVKQNNDRLVALINDLLDISRIESGRIHLKIQPIDMGDIIAGTVETFKAVLEQTQMTVETSVSKSVPHAAGDRDRVAQVLINLISNAIKYAPGASKIAVRARRRANQVVVSVKDYGIGVSGEDQKRLFSKFYRVDSSLTRDVGGTGLGLSICKTIIELLGGQIWVESKVGKGSTFSFSLPIAPRELARMPDVEAPLDAEKGGKVLVVDRDPEIANLIEIYLRKAGYDVLKAYTAEEAVRKAAQERPRVITLDVMLDTIDGFDLLGQLKENPETSSIPVVILSVVCDEGKSWRVGAANYLEKPIDQDRLVTIIDELVGSIDTPLVLVVDDDKQIVDVLCRTLKSKGLAVASAYNGLEAMVAIENKKPDLVLLDVRMPEMDGYQVIERLKKSERTVDIPIVVMTAYHFHRDKIDIVNMAAEQVAKPFKVEQLVQKVEELLAKEQATH